MKTPISYYGGKQKMIKWILPKIPKHKTYVEPFFGGGAVFFAKQPSQIEVINDIDGRVYNFWLMTVERYDEVKELVDLTLHSRVIYDTAKEWLDDPDPVKRAWAFWYQINGSFNSKMSNGFGINRTPDHYENPFCENKKNLYTNKIYERLKNVYIENLSAIDIMDSWDSADTFIYEDPPYFNSDCGHYKGYTDDDFRILLRMNAVLKGKFLLSCYPSELADKYIRENGWNFEDREMNRAAGLDNEGARKVERLIWNYEIEKGLFD